jgi:hypothetical protein
VNARMPTVFELNAVSHPVPQHDLHREDARRCRNEVEEGDASDLAEWRCPQQLEEHGREFET